MIGWLRHAVAIMQQLAPSERFARTSSHVKIGIITQLLVLFVDLSVAPSGV